LTIIKLRSQNNLHRQTWLAAGDRAANRPPCARLRYVESCFLKSFWLAMTTQPAEREIKRRTRARWGSAQAVDW